MRKRFLTLVLTAALFCVCAACTAPTTPESTPTPSPSPSPSPTPSATPDVTPSATPSATPDASSPTPGQTTDTPPPFLDGDDYPSTKEIYVTREGTTDPFTAELRISDLGYVIYILPGFEFVPAGHDTDYDMIRPDADSPIMSGFALLIRQGSGSPPPEAGPWEDVYREFKLGGVHGRYLEAELHYPLVTWPSEAREGAGALLLAMWDTVEN